MIDTEVTEKYKSRYGSVAKVILSATVRKYYKGEKLEPYYKYKSPKTRKSGEVTLH